MPKPFWTSCFLVDGLLIDTGAPGGVGELKDFLTQLPSKEQVVACILTHAHEDHAGGAKMISEEMGIPVYIHPKGVHFVQQGHILPDYGQITWGERLLPVPLLQVLPASPFTTKSRRYHFDLIPMPGHAPCLVALLEKTQQWAFVADAVQPKYQMIFGPTTYIHENIAQIYQSLVNLSQITNNIPNLKLFIAGHGMMENGRTFLQEHISEIDTLHTQVHQLHDQGYPAGKILRTIFGGESFTGKLSRGEMSRMNLVEALLDSFDKFN